MVRVNSAGAGMYKSMNLDELIEEHKRVVSVLESDTHEDDKREAKTQKKELEGYIKKKRNMSKGRIIIKGRKASIGEIRTHGGKKMKKEGDGTWKPVVVARGKKAKEEPKRETSSKEVEKETSGKEVDTEKEASIKLEELAKMAIEAKEKGTKAPNFNLCDISIPNTNLFCKDNKGVVRAKMPQLKGEAAEGTEAAKIAEETGEKEVDGEEAFKKYLKDNGVKMTNKSVPADGLKSTQSELVGVKVAGMTEALKKDPNHPAITAPIFVSKDGYVLDGHHRWAAHVGLELSKGKPVNMDIVEVDMPIKELLKESNDWANEFGIAQKAGKVDEKETQGASLKEKNPELFKKIQKKGKGEGLEITLGANDIDDILQYGKIGFISAGRNPEDKRDVMMSESKVEHRYRKLKSELIQKGYVFLKVHGKYGEEEDSFMVMVNDVDKNDMRAMGTAFNQDSVIYSEGNNNELLYTTGDNKHKKHVGSGFNKLGEDAQDFYSEIDTKDGKVKFSLNFDWEKLVKAMLARNIIIKGRRASVGEVRTYGNKKMQKQGDGSWKPVKSNRTKKEDDAPKRTLKREEIKDTKGGKRNIWVKTKEKVNEYIEKQRKQYEDEANGKEGNDQKEGNDKKGKEEINGKESSTFLKRKMKAIVKGVKKEIEEWKEAGHGIGKFVRGEELNTHEKKAIRDVAIHVGIVVALAASSGAVGAATGLGAKAATLGSKIGLGYLEHAGLMRTGHALLFGKGDNEILDILKAIEESPNEDEANHHLERMIMSMANYMENSHGKEQPKEKGAEQPKEKKDGNSKS